MPPISRPAHPAWVREAVEYVGGRIARGTRITLPQLAALLFLLNDVAEGPYARLLTRPEAANEPGDGHVVVVTWQHETRSVEFAIHSKGTIRYRRHETSGDHVLERGALTADVRRTMLAHLMAWLLGWGTETEWEEGGGGEDGPDPTGNGV